MFLRRSASSVAGLYCLLFSTIAFSRQQEDKKPVPGEPVLARGIRSVAFSADGRLLAAGLGEPKELGRVVLWDASRRKQLWSHEDASGIPAVAFSPDGKHLAIGLCDNTAKLLEATTGRVLKILHGHTNHVRAVAFSPDGKTLATGGLDHAIKLWDLADGTERKTLRWPEEQLLGLSFSPSGHWLLAAGKEARIWDTATGAKKVTVRPYYVGAAVFVDEDWFLTGGYDGTIRLWNTDTGKERLRFNPLGGIHFLALSGRARLVAESGFSRTVRLFEFSLDAPTAKTQQRIGAALIKLDDDDYDTRESASKEMLSIGFAVEPDLRRVMKESPSTEVRIRCRRLREQLLTRPRATLMGHTDRVESLVFSPDGSLLATGSRDGSLRLWGTKDFKEAARLVPLAP